MPAPVTSPVFGQESWSHTLIEALVSKAPYCAPVRVAC